jgi:aryl-alcohol dehydrogenase-like predicted oxidoreductase
VGQKLRSLKHIFASVKESLKRLDVEYIDVLQCHRWSFIRTDFRARNNI